MVGVRQGYDIAPSTSLLSLFLHPTLYYILLAALCGLIVLLVHDTSVGFVLALH
jgi:hypothetical protein